MYKSNKNIQRINKKKADSNLMNQLNGRNQKNVVHFKNINHNNLTKSKNSSFTKNYMDNTKKNFMEFS